MEPKRRRIIRIATDFMIGAAVIALIIFISNRNKSADASYTPAPVRNNPDSPYVVLANNDTIYFPKENIQTK